jgi:hypothetical protein
MHATNQSQLRAILDNNVFIEWVPVDQIDRTPYARPISTTMLKRMVEAAKTQTRKQTQDNLGIVTLTLQPTGRYNCVDGNHRTALARALGLETILARIVIDLSPEQEAQLFEMIHTVNLPTAQDRFRARLYRYDPVAMDIQRSCATTGWTSHRVSAPLPESWSRWPRSIRCTPRWDRQPCVWSSRSSSRPGAPTTAELT